jgi:hypothetical protein
MIIYSQETDDGLAETISALSSVAYASVLYPATKSETKNFIHKSSGSFKDSDLYYVQSILVSSSWNKNDDIFDKAEVWNARKTPEDKPTNLEHDENIIIGHITSNWPIDENGEIIEDDTELGELPEKFHILTGSVIYRAFSNIDLKERAEKLISEIENGSKYVSMECYFQNFDYGLLNQSNGRYQILPRNESTAYLTKYLRSYGGNGEHENHKIGRVLRNITFSGKGFVDKPANPDSIIFTKENINKIFAKKNNNLSNSGVILNKSTSIVENITMTENLEKQVAELGTKIDTVSANCADTVKEAYSLASELKNTNQTLEAAMKDKEEEMKKMKAALEEVEAAIKKTQEEKDAEMKKMKAAFDEELEALAKKYTDEKTEVEEMAKKTKSELDAANEIIVAMKMEKEEMAKKEKKMKRMACLLDSGLDNDTATATLDKFDTMDDESFDAMIALFAAMKPYKKEEKGMMNPMMKKNMSSEEIVSALDDIEPEDTIDLGIGNDTIESQADSIRAELIEFVSARLNRNS